MPERLFHMPQSLGRLLEDDDRARPEAQIRALVDGLEAQGIPRRAVCNAMFNVFAGAVLNEYYRWDEHRLWAKAFLRDLSEELLEALATIEVAEQQILRTRKARVAGITEERGCHEQ